MKVDEVVWVINADVSSGQWSLGREGDNVFVEFMKVQVGVSVVTYSITKICPLEVNDGISNITTVRYGRGEWTREIFAVDILQEKNTSMVKSEIESLKERFVWPKW